MNQVAAENVLEVEVSAGIAKVTLTRPNILNAVNRRVRNELAQAFDRLAADEAVRVVILTGAGRAFCSGQDQNESAGMTAADAAQRIEDYGTLYRSIRNILKPVLASVHGYAIGAGLQIALLADYIFAARSAKLGMPELERGSASITGSGLMWPIIGEGATKELVLRGDRISADEAARMRLVHEVVDDSDLDGRVYAFAEMLAARPTTGFRVTKEWWNKIGNDLFELTLSHARHAHAQNFASGDFTGSAQQFLNRKR